MAGKLESNPTLMEMARYLSEHNRQIKSNQAVLYSGSTETDYPVYKLLKARTWGLLIKHGIDPGSNFEILNDALARIPAPKLSTTKKKYKNLDAALWGIEQDKLVSKKQAGVLWKRASLFFARNSRIVAIVVAKKLRSDSVLLSVEALILSFRHSELGEAEREKVKQLMANRRKVTREIRDIDANIYDKAREAENRLKQRGWKLDYGKLKKLR